MTIQGLGALGCTTNRTYNSNSELKQLKGDFYWHLAKESGDKGEKGKQALYLGLMVFNDLRAMCPETNPHQGNI